MDRLPHISLSRGIYEEMDRNPYFLLLSVMLSNDWAPNDLR